MYGHITFCVTVKYDNVTWNRERKVYFRVVGVRSVRDACGRTLKERLRNEVYKVV